MSTDGRFARAAGASRGPVARRATPPEALSTHSRRRRRCARAAARLDDEEWANCKTRRAPGKAASTGLHSTKPAYPQVFCRPASVSSRLGVRDRGGWVSAGSCWNATSTPRIPTCCGLNYCWRWAGCMPRRRPRRVRRLGRLRRRRRRGTARWTGPVRRVRRRRRHRPRGRPECLSEGRPERVALERARRCAERRLAERRVEPPLRAAGQARRERRRDVAELGAASALRGRGGRRASAAPTTRGDGRERRRSAR